MTAPAVSSSAAPERLVLTTPRRSLLLAVAACAAFLVLGLWTLTLDNGPIVKVWTWIGIVCLGAGVVLGLLNLRRPAQLVLVPESFSLTGVIGVGPIPWQDVEAFFVYVAPEDAEGSPSLPYASWRLKPDSIHASGLASRVNRAGGMDIDGSVPRNIGMEPEPLAQLLENWRVRYG